MKKAGVNENVNSIVRQVPPDCKLPIRVVEVVSEAVETNYLFTNGQCNFTLVRVAMNLGHLGFAIKPTIKPTSLG
jgi:hypothetical protein